VEHSLPQSSPPLPSPPTDSVSVRAEKSVMYGRPALCLSRGAFGERTARPGGRGEEGRGKMSDQWQRVN